MTPWIRSANQPGLDALSDAFLRLPMVHVSPSRPPTETRVVMKWTNGVDVSHLWLQFIQLVDSELHKVYCDLKNAMRQLSYASVALLKKLRITLLSGFLIKHARRGPVREYRLLPPPAASAHTRLARCQTQLVFARDGR